MKQEASSSRSHRVRGWREGLVGGAVFTAALSVSETGARWEMTREGIPLKGPLIPPQNLKVPIKEGLFISQTTFLPLKYVCVYFKTQLNNKNKVGRL